MSSNELPASPEHYSPNDSEDDEPKSFLARVWEVAMGRDDSVDTANQLNADLDNVELSKKECLHLHKHLLKSRRKIKGQMAESAQTHTDTQERLIETYKRLYQYADERDDCPDWTNDDWNDLHTMRDEHESAGSRGISDALKGRPAKTEQEKEQYSADREQLKDINKEVEEATKSLNASSNALGAQHKSFNVFLQDQGRVLALIEKATSKSLNKGNDFKRSGMYQTIVEALSTSPALLNMDPDEAQSERDEIHAVLRLLEGCESRTDELIQRVMLKIQAVQRVEKSASAQLEDQLSTQEGMNMDLDILTEKIGNNNESVKERTLEMKTDVLNTVRNLTQSGKVKTIICCVLSIVAVVVIALIVYMLDSL